MGYVHITDISQFIPPSSLMKTAGTWTDAVGTSVPYIDRTPAAAAFTLAIPIPLPSSAIGLQAARLQAVQVWYTIGVEAATGFATAAIVRVNLRTQTLAPNAGLVASTPDGDHDTADKRRAVAVHHMTLSLTSPPWLLKQYGYYVQLTVDAHLNTEFRYHGAQADYTLRL